MTTQSLVYELPRFKITYISRKRIFHTEEKRSGVNPEQLALCSRSDYSINLPENREREEWRASNAKTIIGGCFSRDREDCFMTKA